MALSRTAFIALVTANLESDNLIDRENLLNVVNALRDLVFLTAGTEVNITAGSYTDSEFSGKTLTEVQAMFILWFPGSGKNILTVSGVSLAGTTLTLPSIYNGTGYLIQLPDAS